MIGIIKRLKKSEFFRSVFTLISASSIAQLIGIVIYPVLSRIYTTSEHGTFALYLSIISITGIISTGKYEAAILMPKEDKKAVNLAALSISISLIISLILLILIILFKDAFSSRTGERNLTGWLWFIPLSTFLIGIIQTLSFLANRHKKYGGIAVADVGQSLSSSVFKVSTSNVLSNGGGLIAGTIFGQIIGMVLFSLEFLRKEIKVIKEVSIKEMKKMAGEYSFFPRYTMIHYLTNNFSGNLPVFLITFYYTSSEVGLYSLAFLMVFKPMSLITVSFTQVFSQRIISDYNKGKKIFADIKRMVMILVQFGLPVFLLAGFFGPVIFNFVFGTQWKPSGKIMQILIPWLFVVFISSPLSFLPDMLKRQKKAMWLDILKFIIRIPAFGIGVYYNNLYLAIIMFSLVSLLFAGYNLYWYLSLARISDIQENKGHELKGRTEIYTDEIRDF